MARLSPLDTGGSGDTGDPSAPCHGERASTRSGASPLSRHGKEHAARSLATQAGSSARVADAFSISTGADHATTPLKSLASGPWRPQGAERGDRSPLESIPHPSAHCSRPPRAAEQEDPNPSERNAAAAGVPSKRRLPHEVLQAPAQPKVPMDRRGQQYRFNQERAVNRGGGNRAGWQGQGNRGWVPRNNNLNIDNRGGVQGGIHGRGAGDQHHHGGGDPRLQNLQQEPIPQVNPIANQQVGSVEAEASVNNNGVIAGNINQNVQGAVNGAQNSNMILFCQRCGMVGHNNDACTNPVICTRCHKEGHVARVCAAKMPWDFISPFCGLSAYGQGFHVIESSNTEEGIRDMSTVGVVTITQGQATAREIEHEFYMKAGGNSNWRWYAKKIGEGKYQVRFPNVQALEDITFFTEMRMRTAPNVVLKVEKWNPSTGSKGPLDVAWFRISNIPPGKRSYSTVCMIASKVGLPLEVDKDNLNKNDYVRVKIGCRDVTKVPASVDGVLDFQFYDYFFQREVPQEGLTNQAGTQWVRTGRDQAKEDIPSPKKQKLNQDKSANQSTQAGPSNFASGSKGKQVDTGESGGQKQQQECSEGESEDNSFLNGDLIVPGTDHLRFGSFDMLDLKKVRCITVDVDPKAVINEYGSNMMKYKQDSLVTIEAKNAINESSKNEFFSFEYLSDKSGTSKKLPTIQEESEEGQVQAKSSEMSPMNVSQGAPEIEISSQEDLSQKSNQMGEWKKLQEEYTKEMDYGENRHEEVARESKNSSEDKEEVKVVEATWEDEKGKLGDENSKGKAADQDDKMDWQEWQKVRQSKRIRANGNPNLTMEEQAQVRKDKAVDAEGLLKEDLKEQMIQGAEVVKKSALAFHHQGNAACSQEGNQLIPY